MATTTDIRVPDDLTEGTRAQVLRWFKAVGDTVHQDEPLLELETDKVTVEVAAPCDGTLVEIMSAPQAECPAGTVVGRLASSARGEPVVASAKAEASSPHHTPRLGRRDPQTLLSPAVRSLIHEHHLDPALITGSGRDGRLTAADVKAYLASQLAALAPPPVIAPPTVSLPVAPPSIAPCNGDGSQRVAHTAVRRRIAQRMVESLLHTAPHVTSVFEADLGAVLAHRARHRAALERRGVQLTLTAYFAKACVTAVRAVPETNARWHDDGLELFDHLDLGIATALSDGSLVVPVLRRVEQYTVLAIAEQLTELTRRARTGELTRADVAPGTFTLSNYGVSGSLIATPVIINQPQSAILGIGKLEKRVVVLEHDGQDTIAIRPRCYVALTIDHRVMDGQHANRFLSVFTEALQNPE
jgi:2-oxoglutarate dehydrogenase E2 component (dihydrolipoamide succinyltransferase)